jgi:hypothetical protein
MGMQCERRLANGRKMERQAETIGKSSQKE